MALKGSCFTHSPLLLRHSLQNRKDLPISSHSNPRFRSRARNQKSRARNQREIKMSLTSSSSLRGRALSSKKEMEGGEASFRVYYGATGAAVPFMWESQPGTPKHPMFDKSNDNTVPPLTPPPSYNSSSTSSSFRKARKSWILSAFSLSSSRNRNMTSSHVTPTSSISSSSSGHIRSWSTSSSSSSSASLSSPGGRKKQVSYHKRSASSSLCFLGQKSPLLEVNDLAVGSTSPPATLCFGFAKKAILSV